MEKAVTGAEEDTKRNNKGQVVWTKEDVESDKR